MGFFFGMFILCAPQKPWSSPCSWCTLGLCYLDVEIDDLNMNNRSHQDTTYKIMVELYQLPILYHLVFLLCLATSANTQFCTF